MLHHESKASAHVHLQHAGSPGRLLVTGAGTDLYSDQAVLHTCSAALPSILCCENNDRSLECSWTSGLPAQARRTDERKDLRSHLRGLATTAGSILIAMQL